LDEPWPKEILNLPESREVRDAKGTLIARGLSAEPSNGYRGYPLRHAGGQDGPGLAAHGLLRADGESRIPHGYIRKTGKYFFFITFFTFFTFYKKVKKSQRKSKKKGLKTLLFLLFVKKLNKVEKS
jgi:hypothetical protein